MICAAIERCAGIDVGKKFLAVCVLTGPLEGEPRAQRLRYGTTVAELVKLRELLQSEGVTHVVMESTGSYWKPVFNVLEDVVKVYVANPQEVKARKGHKTDDKDGWWLAHLLRHAMIHPSFIPPRPIRELRDFTRRRKRLLGDATSERNRVQKILEDANVKLGNELSDVFGASGQLMLDALLKGRATVEEITQFARGRANKKIPKIIAALEGHLMSDHHRKMIRYSLEHLRFLEDQIAGMDDEIRAKIREAKLEPQWELLQTVPAIARWLNIDPDKVVFISEYTGGGFGSKITGGVSMIIPALLAKKANAPVMMRISQEEELFIGRARPGFQGRMRVGFSKEGRIMALDMFVISNNGPYQALGDVPTSGRIVSLLYQPQAEISAAAATS